MIDKITGLISVARDWDGIFALLKWIPYSITSYRMVARVKKVFPELGTIIDGGANIGQFARAVIENYPSARIVSFEPLPDIAEKYRANLRDEKTVEVIAAALGNRRGHITFHRNVHSHSSSALALADRHKNAFPDAVQLEDLEVPIVTLDQALRGQRMKGPVLLKLDLQGYEMEALKGARNTLKHVDAILLETAFDPLYENEVVFSDIDLYLRKKGFYFSRALDFMKDRKGDIVQMDALFLRRRK